MMCDQEMLSSSWTRIEYVTYEGYAKVLWGGGPTRNLLPFTIKDVYIPDVMCNVSIAKLSVLLLCTQAINEIAMKGKVPTELLFCVCNSTSSHQVLSVFYISWVASCFTPQDQDLNFLFVWLYRLQKIQPQYCKTWELTAPVEVKLK